MLMQHALAAGVFVAALIFVGACINEDADPLLVFEHNRAEVSGFILLLGVVLGLLIFIFSIPAWP